MSHIILGALILAGGQNRRMGGSPKALLPMAAGPSFWTGSAPPLPGFDEKLLSTNTPELAAGTGFAPVPDARPAWARWPGWQQRFLPARATALWSPPVICPVLTGPQPSFWPALQTRAGPPGPCGTALAASTRSAASTPNSASRPFRRPSPPGEHRVGWLFQSVGGQAISLEGTSLPDAVVCNVNTPEELKELLQS